MVESVSAPKQMVAYDRFKIIGRGYTIHDDRDGFDEAFEEEIPWNPLQDRKNCAYCSTKLLKVEDGIFRLSSHREYCLWYCRNCRFWQARLYSDRFMRHTPPDHWAYISKLREFNTNLPEGCNAELALYIRSHPDFLYSCDPTHFEKIVADVFRANYTNAEVLHVGQPKDGGVDVLLINAEKEQWLIQVKRRGSQNSTEGVSTIRDMLGAMIVEGVHRGIVVSTANRFSRDAIQAVAKAKAGPYRMNIRLVDSGLFNKMLAPILPDRPWLLPISEFNPKFTENLMDRIPSDNQLEIPFSET